MKKLFKKLKGFTLIELLAVIVILAIISLIAVPIVLDIINDSRKSAAIESARSYVKAVNFKIAEEELKDNIIADGDYVIGNNALAVTVKNAENIIGMYTIQDNYVMWAGLCVNNYSIAYNATTSYFGISEDSDYCEGEFPHIFVEPDGILVSEVYEDQTKYADNTYFKIKTVEDLVALSELVNGGKDFSGKTIYLVSNLDFNSDDSYSNPNTTAYGDINGDSTTSGLKTEVTTGKGFKPIGAFSGTFEGYAFTISNLMINRTSESSIGLFSNNSGNIKGLKLKDISVSGLGSVGGLVGTNTTGTISNILVEGNISSINNSAGGIVGYYTSGTMTNSVVKNATIQGNSLVGGLVGCRSNGAITGLVYDSTLTATANSASIGKATAYNAPTAAMTSNVQLVYPGNRGNYSYDGTPYTTGSILIYDKVIDTIVGGDTDGDHYYFDLTSSGELELYSTDVTPIKTFKQSGTEDSPYIIKTVKDWKRATATIGSTPHYYSLEADLDFTNTTFYPMGTGNNSFNGVFLGNHHTISNLNVIGYDNVGVFGKNTGTIKDLNFNNLTITGVGDNMGIVAYSEGTINGIKVRSANITNNATSYVSGLGGIVGTSSGGTIKNIDMQGNVLGNTSYVNRVGGIMGSGTSVITDTVFKGTVTGNGSVGGILGQNSGQTHKAVVYDSTITAPGSMVGKATTYNWAQYIYVSSSTILDHTGSRDWSYDGTAFTDITLAAVDSVIDTTINGDTDEDGYYFTLENGEYELITAE